MGNDDWPEWQLLATKWRKIMTLTNKRYIQDHKDTGKVIAMKTNLQEIQSVDYDCGDCINCRNGVKTLNMNTMTYVGACGARATYTFAGVCWNCGEKRHRNGECNKTAEICNKCKGAHRTDMHDIVYKSRGTYVNSKTNYNNGNKSNSNGQSMHNKLKSMPKAFLSHIDASITDGDMQQWAISDAFEMYRDSNELEDEEQTTMNIIDLNTNIKINDEVVDLAGMKILAGIDDNDLSNVEDIEYNLDQYKKYKEIKEDQTTGCQRFANMLCDMGDMMKRWIGIPKSEIDDDDLDDFDDVFITSRQNERMK